MKNILKKANNNLVITNFKKFEDYIKFCIKNSESKKIHITALHHILPKARDCWPEYKNLTENSWNGVYLSHVNHLQAHILLAKALEKSYSQHCAIIAMCDMSISRGELLSEQILNTISLDGIQELREKRSKLQSIYLKSVDETGLNIAQKRAIKSIKTKNIINPETGNSFLIDSARKCAEIRKNSFDEFGESISMRGGRLSKEKRSEINVETGLSFYEESARRGAKTKYQNCQKYNILAKSGKIIFTNISLSEIRKISQALTKSSKEKPLGITKKAKISLNACKLLYLIGSYIVKI